MNPGLLQREMDKYVRFTQLEDMTQDDLDQADQALWAAWLEPYCQRLKQDVVAGAGAAEDIRKQQREVDCDVVAVHSLLNLLERR
jgi:hypothetical protein